MVILLHFMIIFDLFYVYWFISKYSILLWYSFKIKNPVIKTDFSSVYIIKENPGIRVLLQ